MRLSSLRHRMNSAFTGASTVSSARRGPATAMAMVSGDSLARALGDTSPKIRISTVMTTVEAVAPKPPSHMVNSTVAMDVPAIFTTLLPTRMVVSRRS